MRRGLAILLLVLGLAGTAAAQRRATGLTFLDESQYRSIPLASPPLRGELPATVDLSRYFPTPGDQGQQPSCVGWATAYALKSFQEAQEHKWQPDSVHRQFSPAFVYNQIKMPGGGSHFTSAFDVLIEQGAASLAEFPYDDGNDQRLPDAATKQRANPFRCATWRRVNAQDRTEIKGHLAAHFPVLVGCQVGDEFQNHRGAGNFTLPTGQPVTGGGHAMVIVGYDDGRGAFLLMNSWGTGWGNAGFGWVAYDTFIRMVREAYVVQDIVSPIVDTPDTPDTPPPPPPRTVEDVPPLPVNPQQLITVAQALPPRVDHNQMHPQYGQYFGMRITPQGWVRNGRGRQVQVVTRFTMPNGQMLVANPQERVFRDVTGQVAVGTQQLALGQDYVDLAGTNFFIPYYALNMQPTGGRMNYQLFATMYVYIDGFEICRSNPTPFLLRW